MFDSIYSAQVTASQMLTMALSALLSGLLYSWLISFRIRAAQRYFVVCSIIPFVVGLVLTFVNGNIGAGIAFGGAFALVRFRSAQGSAEEMAGVLVAMAAGVPFGMGYIGYGVAMLIVMGLLLPLLSSLPIYEHKHMQEEKLLRVTIPESLDYSQVFDDIFEHYLSSAESIGIKTTGMGSMFRLSYRIRMKNPSEEKAFIDELRTRNGNLEIAVLPYQTPQNEL